MCHLILFNHDPDLRISPQHCRQLVPLQEGQREIQPQARRDFRTSVRSSDGLRGVGGAFSTPAKESVPMLSDDEDAAELITLDDDAADADNALLETGPA